MSAEITDKSSIREIEAIIDQKMREERERNCLRTRGFPDGDNVLDAVQRRIAAIIAKPEGSTPPGTPSTQHSTPNTSHRCASCLRIPTRITRHHLVPREVGTNHKTIRLCRPCHAQIHYLSNYRIAAMSEAEQIRYIRVALSLVV